MSREPFGIRVAWSPSRIVYVRVPSLRRHAAGRHEDLLPGRRRAVSTATSRDQPPVVRRRHPDDRRAEDLDRRGQCAPVDAVTFPPLRSSSAARAANVRRAVASGRRRERDTGVCRSRATHDARVAVDAVAGAAQEAVEPRVPSASIAAVSLAGNVDGA